MVVRILLSYYITKRMPPITYETALAFLQKSQTTEGSSIYEHLTKVLAKVGIELMC
jgi:hypothetical protein